MNKYDKKWFSYKVAMDFEHFQKMLTNWGFWLFPQPFPKYSRFVNYNLLRWLYDTLASITSKSILMTRNFNFFSKIFIIIIYWCIFCSYILYDLMRFDNIDNKYLPRKAPTLSSTLWVLRVIFYICCIECTNCFY